MKNSKKEAEDWARAQMALPAGKALVLDSETCDLYGEIIELAIIDTGGQVLYNRRFSPLTEISPGAYHVHLLTAEVLANEPRFSAEHERIKSILASAEIVLIYNASFDVGCLDETCRIHQMELIPFKTGCIMHWYAQWYGEWSDYRRFLGFLAAEDSTSTESQGRRKTQNYKWQPLRGGDHSALGDCRAALAALRRMAAQETPAPPADVEF